MLAANGRKGTSLKMVLTLLKTLTFTDFVQVNGVNR